MDEHERDFLIDLLEAPSPAGFEAAGQRVWVDYVSTFADEVHTDAYGNAVAVHRGGDPDVALTGHADEVGFIVRGVDDGGFLRISRIGSPDPSTARGQHVEVHAEDGSVPGVIGQSPVHVRDGNGEVDDVEELRIDVGAPDEETARELVSVGDPVTITTQVTELADGRLVGRGMDNRTGTWAAAEGLRRAAERDAAATVYAVSTVQEELGMKGARMVGHDLDPDAVVAVDVTHATDAPDVPEKRYDEVELGDGPVVGRGSANHPVLGRAVREAAEADDIDVQLQAAGRGTGTDADGFYTRRGGIPSVNVSVPNRYMHTPVELIDLDDLDATADLLAAFAVRAHEHDQFAVDI